MSVLCCLHCRGPTELRRQLKRCFCSPICWYLLSQPQTMAGYQSLPTRDDEVNRVRKPTESLSCCGCFAAWLVMMTGSRQTRSASTEANREPELLWMSHSLIGGDKEQQTEQSSQRRISKTSSVRFGALRLTECGSACLKATIVCS